MEIKKLSEELRSRIASYIEENYVELWATECCCVEKRECMAVPMAMPKATVGARLKPLDISFTEDLLKRIDKAGKKDAEIYKKAHLSKQHFSKIRNNPDYKPTKPTAIALALALELNLEETQTLIGRAGYILTNSSKFDLIIQYCIEEKIYNIVDINLALYEFDQPLLGA